MEDSDKFYPYKDLNEDEWVLKTFELVNQHPLDLELIKKVVFSSWELILNAKIGDYSIGEELILSPQAMGTLLHEIIPLEIKKEVDNVATELWKKDTSKQEKDLEYIPDNFFSIEIKTSSQSGIYGNRSYAQPQTEDRKSKDGFYLAINFEPFSEDCLTPKITKIRFGWLNHSDWKPQASETGQQAYVRTEAKKNKLIELYSSNRPEISFLNVVEIVRSLNEGYIQELENLYGIKVNAIKDKVRKMGYSYDRSFKKYIKNQEN
jgi:hypothetical protein